MAAWVGLGEAYLLQGRYLASYKSLLRAEQLAPKSRSGGGGGGDGGTTTTTTTPAPLIRHDEEDVVVGNNAAATTTTAATSVTICFFLGIVESALGKHDEAISHMKLPMEKEGHRNLLVAGRYVEILFQAAQVYTIRGLSQRILHP